MFLKNTPY